MTSRSCAFWWCLAACASLLAGPALGGEFRKSYFEATRPGAWSEYLLTSPDGTKSEFSYERQRDEEGRVVIEMGVKNLTGPGQGSLSKFTYTLPRDFDFVRNGMSYGKFAEKMTMNHGGADMPVDEKTLAVIRDNEKDFRNAVTFEAAETVEGHACDRYSYTLRTGGAAPTVETGRLWLDPAVPFGLVRQAAKVTKEDGTPVMEFDMRLQDSGLNQALAEVAPAPAPAASVTPAISKTSLQEGFLMGLIGLEVEAVPGSKGRRLRLMLQNKSETELTVSLSAGDVDVEAASPVNTLKLAIPKEEHVVLPAGEKSEAVVVGQRGTRGIVEGSCSLSVYEGTPLFSGSVTMDALPK